MSKNISDLDFFKKNGFLKIKNFLDNKELNEIRKEITTKYHNTKNNNIIEKIIYGDEILKRFINKVKNIFNKNFYYIGESDCKYKYDTGSKWWHLDIKSFGENPPHETLDPINPDFVRCFIYFQDHGKYSYGTKFIKGSHLKTLYRFWNYKFYLNPRSNFPKEIKYFLKKNLENNDIKLKNLLPVFPIGTNLPVNAGDLVFWSPRTIHAGNYIRMKYLKKLYLPVFVEKLIQFNYPQFIYKNPLERAILSISIGQNNQVTKSYVQNRNSHKIISNKFLNEYQYFENDTKYTLKI